MNNFFSDEPFQELLKTHSGETPFFIFSKEKITSKITEFKKHFPGASIFYAMKANAEKELLETVASTGVGFEVASVYELELLKELQIDPKKIIYGTSVKAASAIKTFFEYGVRIFAFDSISELEKIAANAPGAKVYIRISVNETGSIFKFSEKFGAEKENILPFLIRAKELGLVPFGLSFHVGSQASNPEAWANAFKEISKPLEDLVKADITLEVINIGGGFPCQYAISEKVPSLEEIATLTLESYKKLPYQPNLFLEPGRAIVAESGTLVTQVIGRVERRGNTWLFLDAGVYSGLFEAMAYQGSTRYPIMSLRTSYNSGETLFCLAGPTGDSPDVITKEALLPNDMGLGDKLLIQHIGAYSLPAICPFNGFPKPAVYFI